MTDSPKDSTNSILKFCPGCGAEINWNKENRFCMVCGMYLIPYIPKNKIQEWLGELLTSEEINELYSKTPVRQQTPTELYPIVSSFDYQTRRPWRIGPALWVPLVAIIAKLIVSVVLLVIYLSIAVGFENLDPNNLDVIITEHAVPITIIEFITQIAFLLVPYWLTSRYFPYKAPKKERWQSLGIPFGLKGKQWVIEISIGVGFSLLMTGLVIGMQYASAYLTQALFGIPADILLNTETDSITTGISGNVGFIIVYCLFMIVTIAPSEEVLFRGFTQKGIQDTFKDPKWGKAIGLILTAAYFSLFHIYGILFIEEAYAYLRAPLLFFTFIPYLSVSLVLGFLYMWRKNLISAITAHALYNIIQILIFVIIIP